MNDRSNTLFCYKKNAVSLNSFGNSKENKYCKMQSEAFSSEGYNVKKLQDEESLEMEDEDDLYFNPLVYCSVTMEENTVDTDFITTSLHSNDDYQPAITITPITKNGKFQNTVPRAFPLIEKFLYNNDNKTANDNNNNSSNSNNNDNNNHNKGNYNNNDIVTKIKKYPCQFCNKTFGWSTDLKRHILIHTGERPFKCNICLASFTRNFLLQKHKSKIHHCLTPNETLKLNKSVEDNLMEIKLKMQELENGKQSDRRANKKTKNN